MYGQSFQRIACLTLLLAMSPAGRAPAASPARLTVHVDRPGIQVSPLLYGIFFEEINRAGDGGIYAEMIQNRSFEDNPTKPAAWTLVADADGKGTLTLDKTTPLNTHNPTSLRLTIERADGGRVGVANEGFRGVAVERGKQYRLSLYARCAAPFRGPLTVSIEKADGVRLAAATIDGLAAAWKKFDVLLTADGTDPAAQLVVAAAAPGTVWLDMVSLFPKDTWKGRPNGLRPDLMAMLAAMHPAFVRFPGGCFVEGDAMKDATRWKQTIGDVAQRPGHWNLWGYRSTDGLGYFEYLQMCEDLGAEPLFVINCGMAHKDHVPMDEMPEYVQDALDAIEFANGPADSRWGAQRAAAGHPAPYKLKMIEIGNENGGPLYQERYRLFYDAIKAKYPQMTLVANQPTTSRPTEINDEHYYNSPEFFIGQAGRYDKYDRTKFRVYVGEYAVTQQAGQGNLRAAIGEAAFMTGMERNSDCVVMSSYAPLFCNPGWKRWNPNAIVFDAARAFGTPSYHLQGLFAGNRADVVLPVEIAAPTTAVAKTGMIGVGTWLTQAEFKDIRVEQDGKMLFQPDFAQGLKGWQTFHGKWEVADGALRQTSEQTDCRAAAGRPEWGDYTLSLKARKLAGKEGFLIMFQVRDVHDRVWWNIGGWGNREHGLEGGGLDGPRVPGKIETGRWYDIRVEIHGATVRCYLDGKLIHEATRAAVGSLYAVAGLKRDAGELIVKVVNASAEPLDTAIELSGAAQIAPTGRLTVLTAPHPDDENSFAAPQKVAPQEQSIAQLGPAFHHTFPANSVSVLRVKAAAKASP